MKAVPVVTSQYPSSVYLITSSLGELRGDGQRGQLSSLTKEVAPAILGLINRTNDIVFILQQRECFSYLEIKAY